MRTQVFCLKQLVGDPGLGFAICNIIYASQSSELALAASFICALVILALRALRQARPLRDASWLHDEALPLRLLGVIVMFTSFYTLGAIALGRIDAGASQFVLLQALSALLFGVGNLLLAASLRGTALSSRGIAGTLRLPETWMAAGMLVLGLMAGWQAMVAFPFVAVGYIRALGNIRDGAPEYRGHPKLWYALATVSFALVTTNPWLMAANVLNAACLVALEYRLMPRHRQQTAFA